MYLTFCSYLESLFQDNPSNTPLFVMKYPNPNTGTTGKVNQPFVPYVKLPSPPVHVQTSQQSRSSSDCERSGYEEKDIGEGEVQVQEEEDQA